MTVSWSNEFQRMFVQAATKKNNERQRERDEGRQKADLDRLRFKLNHTTQLLKEEQKEQEGDWCWLTYLLLHVYCYVITWPL